jgi:hypothetical protein
MPKLRWPAWNLVVAFLILSISTISLALVLVPYGSIIGADDGAYLGGAINLVQGNGFVQSYYSDEGHGVHLLPITHYPPLFSVAYAALMMLGIPLVHAPSVLALICWVALLAGIALLTYRLSDSAVLALLSMLLAAVTHAYVRYYLHVFSEILYIPLLIWSMILLIDVHEQSRGVLLRLFFAALLLAALMMTRYVGIIAWGSTMLWWGWCRFRQGQLARLRVEWPVLAIAILPLSLFVLRNMMVSSDVAGHHFQESTFSFAQGVFALLNQSSQFLLPAWPSAWHWFFFDSFDAQSQSLLRLIAITGNVLILVGMLLVLYHKSMQQAPARNWRWLPRSPMLLIIGFYLVLYTLVQPFMSFFPIDDRDMMTLLCLSQPLLLTAVWQLFPRRVPQIVGLAVGVNVLLVLAPVLLVGLPGGLLQGNPLRIADLSNQPDQAARLYRAAVPTWLIVTPFRMGTLERYHADVADYVRDHDLHLATVANYPQISLYSDVRHQPPPRLYMSLQDWLEQGSCTPAVPSAVIIFEHTAHARQAQELVEQKCPDIQPIVMRNSLLYPLPAPPIVASP